MSSKNWGHLLGQSPWIEHITPHEGLHTGTKSGRTNFWLYIQRLYQRRNLNTRCASCGATSPQHQSDCCAEAVTMIHISVETRTSITQPQFNLIEWSAYVSINIIFSRGTTLSPYLRSEMSPSCSSEKWNFLGEGINIIESGKMTTKELFSPLLMTTEMFLLKS